MGGWLCFFVYSAVRVSSLSPRVCCALHVGGGWSLLQTVGGSFPAAATATAVSRSFFGSDNSRGNGDQHWNGASEWGERAATPLETVAPSPPRPPVVRTSLARKTGKKIYILSYIFFCALLFCSPPLPQTSEEFDYNYYIYIYTHTTQCRSLYFSTTTREWEGGRHWDRGKFSEETEKENRRFILLKAAQLACLFLLFK